MQLYQVNQSPYRVRQGLAGSDPSKRPQTMDELKKLPPDQQDKWWKEICAEQVVSAYLSACKDLGALTSAKIKVEASIQLLVLKNESIDDFFKAAKLDSNKAAINEAKSLVEKGCNGLLSVIQKNWVDKKLYESGMGSYQERGYNAAKFEWVKNGGVVSVKSRTRDKPENQIFFADLPPDVFSHPIYGGGIVQFADWFNDAKTREVVKLLYNSQGTGLSAGTKGGGYTVSLDPVVAAYIRKNIVEPAVKLKNLWVFSSSYFTKMLNDEKKNNLAVIKMYKEGTDGINELEAKIAEVKKALPVLLAAISDPLSKAVAMVQGNLLIDAGELEGTQDAANTMTTAAAMQAQGAQVVAKRAQESADQIGAERDGTPESKAVRAGTQAAAAFSASKRSASTKRNGAAKQYNDKGREIIKNTERTLEENRGATTPANVKTATATADNLDKQIKDNATEVIKVGNELKDSLNKITDSSIDKTGTLDLIENNQKKSEEIAGKGGILWLLLIAAAVAANK